MPGPNPQGYQAQGTSGYTGATSGGAGGGLNYPVPGAVPGNQGWQNQMTPETYQMMLRYAQANPNDPRAQMQFQLGSQGQTPNQIMQGQLGGTTMQDQLTSLNASNGQSGGGATAARPLW